MADMSDAPDGFYGMFFSEAFYRQVEERREALRAILEKRLTQPNDDNWLDQLHDYVGEEVEDDDPDVSDRPAG